VQFGHTDAQGRVCYAHYFRLLDQVRCAYWEALGFSEDDVRQTENDTVSVHVEADSLGAECLFADRSQGEPCPPKLGQRRRPRPACEPQEPLHRMTGVDWTRMAGLEETTAEMGSRVRGLDMRPWPSATPGTS